MLPEGEDARVIAAAAQVVREGYATVTLLGREPLIRAVAAEAGTSLDGIALLEPAASPALRQLRCASSTNVDAPPASTFDEAHALTRQPIYFAALAVAASDADGTVGRRCAPHRGHLARRAARHRPGARSQAALQLLSDDSAAAGLQTLRRPGVSGPLLFADCAIVPQPTAEQLAEIARATAESARTILEVEPRVALLSFSTKGSAQHAHVSKVREALNILRARAPELAVDGELQADAALVPRWPLARHPDRPSRAAPTF